MLNNIKSQHFWKVFSSQLPVGYDIISWRHPIYKSGGRYPNANRIDAYMYVYICMIVCMPVYVCTCVSSKQLKEPSIFLDWTYLSIGRRIQSNPGPLISTAATINKKHDGLFAVFGKEITAIDWFRIWHGRLGWNEFLWERRCGWALIQLGPSTWHGCSIRPFIVIFYRIDI